MVYAVRQFGSQPVLQFVRSAAGLVKGCDNVAATGALAAKEFHAADLLDVKEYGGKDGICDRRGGIGCRCCQWLLRPDLSDK